MLTTAGRLGTNFSFNLLAVLVLFQIPCYSAQPDVRLHGHQAVLLSGTCHRRTSEIDLDQTTFRRLWIAVLGLLSISHWYRLFYKCPAHKLCFAVSSKACEGFLQFCRSLREKAFALKNEMQEEKRNELG